MKYVLVNPAIDPKTGKDSGFIECIGVYKSAAKAYGEAVMHLSEWAEDQCCGIKYNIDDFTISLPQKLEGETGYRLYLENRVAGASLGSMAILFLEEQEEAHGN